MTKFKFGDKVRVLPQEKKPLDWSKEMMNYQNKEGIFIKAILGDYCVKFEDGPIWNYTKDQIELVEDKGIQKVVIPKFVADWIDRIKSSCNDVLRMSVKDAMDDLSLDIEDGHADEIKEWLWDEKENWDIFVRAWLDGYEVEKEKTYKVRMVGLYKDEQVLHHSFEEDVWYFRFDFNDGLRHQRDSRYHTKNELEQAGFGDVFDNPMFEVEEVE
ncbi:DUF1642 domain-containing protein [Streptococcus thoraltensis]|uniref:DUF1642 domain-containing protein n=1 Tax=Streptococcus thoraltensis TaxID=55085 RepID=UPI001F59B2E1|nr:DUF1642 domain-containing protein [Streptococcus thoraltensis]